MNNNEKVDEMSLKQRNKEGNKEINGETPARVTDFHFIRSSTIFAAMLPA